MGRQVSGGKMQEMQAVQSNGEDMPAYSQASQREDREIDEMSPISVLRALR
jgi:hypothetical protein